MANIIHTGTMLFLKLEIAGLAQEDFQLKIYFSLHLNRMGCLFSLISVKLDLVMSRALRISC